MSQEVTENRMPEREDNWQGELPFIESADRQLDRFQRIDTLAIIEGFLPATRAEQTEAIGLESFITKPGGAAGHLAEVAKHQSRSVSKDPVAALRAITRNYESWALDAKRRSQELEALQMELTDVNPTLILDRVVTPEQRGVLAFMRFFDLSVLKETKRVDKIGYDPQKVKYETDNPGIMFYAGMAVENWRVLQVRKKLPESLADQGRRMGFFTERLVEVQRHYPVLSPIASAGLDKIYDRSQAS